VISGLFMLMEDQYGVGDVVDLGSASGTVEAIGLRVTTLRDVTGTYWYIPNGEIRRVGNRTQGTATAMVDIPVGFAPLDKAVEVLRAAAERLAEDPDFQDDILEPPQILGVDQVTVEGATVRTTVRTKPEAQWRVARELRQRQTKALEDAGLTAMILAARVYSRAPGGTTTGR
jgi:small-conductance mechanosensitive channel